jgi:cytochrome c5
MTSRLMLAFLLLSVFPLPPVHAAADEAENLYEQSCTRCHNRETMQDKIKDKRLNREAWNDTIQRMISTYGAEVPKNKQGELVDYLMKAFSSAGGEAPSVK